MAYTEDMLLLLISIKNGGSPLFLEKHLSHNITIYNTALSQKYIVENKEKKEVTLTEEGLKYIESANKRLHRKGVDKEIAPLADAYTKKIAITDIYIPEEI